MIRINEKFEPLFFPKKGIRYYIITGGRFSQKSFGASTAICHLATNLNHRVLYTRYTLNSAKDSIIPEYIEKIDLLGYEDFYEKWADRVIAKHNKAKIVFKGLKNSSGNQTAKLKSLKDFSCFVLDEAEEENDEVNFDKINLSIRANDIQNIVILILNPATKEHWVYKRFFEGMGVQPGFNGYKDNVCYIHTTYLDAIEFVPEDYLYEIEQLKINNPEKFDHIIMGGWLDKADGAILKNWKLGAFNNDLPYYFGLDFGFFPDPDCLIRCAIDKKLRLIYLKEEFGENNLSPSILKEKVKAIVGNSLVVADSAEPRLISDIRSIGVNIVKVLKPAGSIKEGLRIMQDYKLIIDSDSTKMVTELNNYCEKNGEPIDAYNHRIDAARYIITTLIKPRTSKGHRVL